MSLLKKINPLFLFSASVYGMSLLGMIQSDQIHGLIGNVIDFYSKHNVVYICAFLATAYSLIQNTQYVFNLTGKLDWLRIIQRCSMEGVIMLFGTFASLLAFLALFATESNIVLSIIIFAITCVLLNTFRSKVINYYDAQITKIVNERKRKMRD